MPYAGNGRIAQDEFEGSIVISDDQYALALEGMCNGHVVTVDDGFKVEPPPAPEIPPAPLPSPEELVAAVLAKRDGMLAHAAFRIAPLQYAVDLGHSTADEIAKLNLWKQYSVDLNRLEQQAGYPSNIDWPESPDESVEG